MMSVITFDAVDFVPALKNVNVNYISNRNEHNKGLLISFFTVGEGGGWGLPTHFLLMPLMPHSPSWHR